jgi:hypothetical protein
MSKSAAKNRSTGPAVAKTSKNLEIRQAARVAAGKKPLGVNPKTDVQAHKALVSRAEYVASSLHSLRSELQRLLSVVVLETTPEPSLLSSKSRREELDTLLVLLAELSLVAPAGMRGHVNGLHSHIESALPRLLSFVEDLDAVQQKAIREIGPAAVHLIGWAWLHRAVLGQRSQLLIDDFPPEWHENVRELLSAWDQAERREQLRGELAEVAFALFSLYTAASRQACLRGFLFGITTVLLLVACTKD